MRVPGADPQAATHTPRSGRTRRRPIEVSSTGRRRCLTVSAPSRSATSVERRRERHTGNTLRSGPRSTTTAEPGSTEPRCLKITRRTAPERLFTPVFIALGVADLCYFTGFGIAIFALPLYVTGPVGGGEALAGLAFGAFALSAFVLRPFVGRLSDFHGRRPFLVGGALLAAISLGSLALTENIVVIVALRLLAGVAEAAFFVAGFAALADVAPPERLGEALSYNSLGLYLGIALGPPLGEILVRTFGFGPAWAGAAALAVLAAGLCLIVGETRAGPPPDGAVHHLIHRPALPILVGFLASLLAMGGFLAFASLYGVRVGLANASLSLLVYGGAVVVCRIAFARVPDRLPPSPSEPRPSARSRRASFSLRRGPRRPA